MSVTIYGDRINYNGYGDQYIAHGSGFGDIGCYISALNSNNSNYNAGDTIAGSTLRYGYTQSGGFSGFTQTNNSTWAGGGTALSGTWRKMSSGTAYSTTGLVYVPAQGYSAAYTYTQYTWFTHLWLRIS